MRRGLRRRCVPRAVGLALLAGVALTGCGEVAPGAAATVDGEAIPLDHVDEIARSVCSAEMSYADSSQTQWQPLPTSYYRDNVLGVLINEQLATKAADELDLDVPPSLSQPPDNEALDAIFAHLDGDDEAAFRDYLAAFGRLQALYFAIGRDQGGAKASGGQRATSAGQAYVADYADEHDVELDPRFGDFTGGQVVGGSGSLSVPLEPTETRTRTPGTPEDVSGLPDSQICQ